MNRGMRRKEKSEKRNRMKITMEKKENKDKK